MAYVEKYFNGDSQVLRSFYLNNSRIQRIAKTEVATAANIGLFNAALVQGMKYKTWLSGRDSNSRSEHTYMDCEQQPIHSPYSNGLMYPGYVLGNSTQVINCRCFQYFV